MGVASQSAGGGEPNDMSGGTPAPDVRKRGRCGRLTTFVGIVLLCVSFWLPQVEGCSDDIVPSHETVESGGTFLFLLALPFLVGFVLAVLYVLRMVLRRVRARATADGVTCVFCVLALLWGAVLVGCVLVEQDIPGKLPSLDLEDLMWIALGGAVWLSLAAALAVAVIRKLGGARRPICVCCTAVPSLFYFVLFVDDALYGLVVSVTACTLITIGSTWEAVRILQHARAPTQAWARHPEPR